MCEGFKGTATSKLIAIEGFVNPEDYPQVYDIGVEVKPEVVVFGKVCRQQRNVGFYSDVTTGYKYSRRIMPARRFAEAPYLKEIMDKVNLELGTGFNGVLVNIYTNGKDYIGAHSDDEDGLDPTNKCVASIAFGAVRKFRIRRKTSGKATNPIVVDCPHKSGTLLAMMGDFQQEFTHEIPKETRVEGVRVSLTFRCHS